MKELWLRYRLFILIGTVSASAGCNTDIAGPTNEAFLPHITIVPLYNFGPEVSPGGLTSHNVTICAPAGVYPEYESKVDRPSVATVIGDFVPSKMEAACSDGRVAWSASVIFRGETLGVAKATIYLKFRPDVKLDFHITVREYYGEKG